jgi:hypothetical protein
MPLILKDALLIMYRPNQYHSHFNSILHVQYSMPNPPQPISPPNLPLPPSPILLPQQTVPHIRLHLIAPPRTHTPPPRPLPPHPVLLQSTQPAPLIRPHRRMPAIHTLLPPPTPRPRYHRHADTQPPLPRRPAPARRQRLHARPSFTPARLHTQFKRPRQRYPLHRCRLCVHHDGCLELSIRVEVGVRLSAARIREVQRQQPARRARAPVVVIWVREVVLWFRRREWARDERRRCGPGVRELAWLRGAGPRHVLWGRGVDLRYGLGSLRLLCDVEVRVRGRRGGGVVC